MPKQDGGSTKADDTKPSAAGSDANKPASQPANTTSTPAESVPTADNTVADIKAYLDAKGISYSSNATKADLLKLIPAK